MKVSAWNEKTDRYELVELCEALSCPDYKVLHPLSQRPMDVDSAFEDALDHHLPEIAADALFELLKSRHGWTNKQMQAFVRRSYLQLFPPGA